VTWFVFVIAGISVCIGFWVASYLDRRNRAAELEGADATEAVPVNQQSQPTIDSVLMHELMEAMQGLTATVDDNVGRHASRIAEISSELDCETTTDAHVVLAAAARLVEANKQLQSDLATAKVEIQMQERQMRSYMTEARTDELTEIGNRRAFEEELERRLSQWKRQGIVLSLVLADIDHFKRFNDYHGHQTGDAVLFRVASAIAGAVRDMDIVARYGGEEFAVILPGTELDDAKIVAERLRTAVADNVCDLDQAELQVTVSAGLAAVLPSEDRDDLIKRADKALYAAKQAGRNCTYSHDGETPQSVPPLEVAICQPLSQA